MQLTAAKKQGLKRKAALLDAFNVWFKEQLKYAPQPEVGYVIHVHVGVCICRYVWMWM